MRRSLILLTLLAVVLVVSGCGTTPDNPVISGVTKTTIYGKTPLSSTKAATWHVTGGKFVSTGTTTATGTKVVWEAPAEPGNYSLTVQTNTAEATVADTLTAADSPVMMPAFLDPGDDGGPVDVSLVNLSDKVVTGVKYYLATGTTLQSKEITGVSIPVLPEGADPFDNYFTYTDNEFGVLLGTFDGWWPYEVTFEDGSTWTL